MRTATGAGAPAVLNMAVCLPQSSSSGLTGGSVEPGPVRNSDAISNVCGQADPPVEPEDDVEYAMNRQNENCYWSRRTSSSQYGRLPTSIVILRLDRRIGRTRTRAE